MNKNILLAIAVCSILYACGGSGQSGSSGQGDKNGRIETDLAKERMSGKVNSVRQRVYWASEKFGRIEKGKLQNMSRQDFLKVYDKNGYLTEETHYDASDIVVSRQTWTYTDHHQLKKTVFYKGTDLADSIIYTYNSKGKLVKMEKFNAEGKSTGRNEYVYYEDSGLLMDEDVYQNDKLSIKYVHAYKGNNLVEKQKYWGGGSLAEKTYYEYLSNNHIAYVNVEKYQNKEASFASRTGYADYNKYGNYGLKIEYDESGAEKAKALYSYDQNGNLTGYAPSALHSEEVFAPQEFNEYVEDDSEGEEVDAPVEVTEVDQPVEVFEMWKEGIGDVYTYEYDTQKNWTSKITYKVDPDKDDHTRQFYYDRVITYY